MKKITIFFALFLLTIQANSQLANGSVAPNFTATDLSGNVHTLYTYLAQGKTVILEFSGVGCGASWHFLKTEALADFYNAYGPSGSNEVVVLYIEDNSSTTVAALNGVSNPPAFGNWAANIPFPIIQGTSLGTTYNISYAPTIYRICPNRVITTIGQQNAYNYLNQVSIGCSVLTGIQNHAIAMENETGFCAATGSFISKIKNYGTNSITSATLNLKENGTVVSTKSFTGSINQFATESISFDPITINQTGTYTIEIVNVNGVSNHKPAFSTAAMNFHTAKATELSLDLKIHTYVCPNNMSFEIRNSAQAIVASGGPWIGAGGICGGPNANTILSQQVTLPSADDCYTLELMDSGGFGWKNYEGNASTAITPGIELYSNGVLIYSKLNVGNFGYSLVIDNFLTRSTVVEEEPATLATDIYPNPSTGLINVLTKTPVEVAVYDVMGKLVSNSKNITSETAIDLSSLQKGIYMARVIWSNGEILTKKIVLK